MGKRVAAIAVLLSILLTSCAQSNVVDSGTPKVLQEEVDMRQGVDVPWEGQPSQALYVTSYYGEVETAFEEQPHYIFSTINGKRIKTKALPAQVGFDKEYGLILTYDFNYHDKIVSAEFIFGPLTMEKSKDYTATPGFIIGKYKDGGSDTAYPWSDDLFITINTFDSNADGDPEFLSTVITPFLENFSATQEEPIRWIVFPELALDTTQPDISYWHVSDSGVFSLFGNDGTYAALYGNEPTETAGQPFHEFRNLYYYSDSESIALADKDGIERVQFFYYEDRDVALTSDVFVLLPKALYYK